MIPSLDGLRAVSILIVFLAHAGVSPLIPGGFGVTIFFFLSGYLITTLLTREFERHGEVRIGAFYLRRFLRLSPPLLISLAIINLGVAVGLVPGSLDPLAIASQALYFHNYYIVYLGTQDESAVGLTILWSLAVEEHFYLVYPFLFVLVARRALGLGTVGAILAAVLVWRGVRFFLLGNDEFTIYVLTDSRIDSILWGCLLAFWQARGVSCRLFTPKRMFPALLLSLIVIMATFMIRDEAFRSTIRYSLQGAALMPIFHYAVNHADAPLFRALNLAPVRRIGLYSYTFYIVHYVVIATLVDNGVPRTDVWLIAPVAFAVSVGYAALLHHTLESPFRRWREALSRAEAKEKPSAA